MKTVMVKKLNTEEFNWINKIRGCSRSNADVSITLVNNSDNHKEARISITMRNGVSEMVTHTGYVTMAVQDNFIYFKESDKTRGYKMSSRNDNGIAYLVFTPYDMLDKFKHMIGDYELNYDSNNKVYFIEKEN